MPASFRLLLLSLAVCLTACATSASRPSTGKPVPSYATGGTPINAPAKPRPDDSEHVPPLRTSAGPAVQTPTAPPVQPVAPASRSKGPIVMGTPLPGVPTPLAATQMPKPFAAQAPALPPASPTDQAMAPFPAATQTPDVQAAQALPAQAGPPTGFGGIVWGTSAKAVAGLAVHEVDPPVSVITYLWPSGPKDVMGAPIRDAYFEFFQDRFYHVWIDIDGMEAYKTALAGLTAAYGPPTTENLEKFYHAWTIGDVNIYCAYHPEEREGDVSFFYQPIYERLDAARKAAHGRGHPARRTNRS